MSLLILCAPALLVGPQQYHSASVSQIARPTDVDEDGEPDEAVPLNDDEDELMFPELVDRHGQ